MNIRFSSDIFNFHRITFEKYHYTDNRKGSPMNYIAYMIKGTAQIISNHSTLKIKERDIFFIPLNLPYESYWHGDNEIEFLSYGFSNIEAKEKLNFNLQAIDCGEELKNQILKIPTEGSSLSCETLSAFYGALSKIIPYLRQSQPVSKKDGIVRNAKKYIRNHTDYSVTDVAREVRIMRIIRKIGSMKSFVKRSRITLTMNAAT